MTTALGEHPETLPIWARLQLAEKGIPFRRVTHFLRSSDGNTIGVAVHEVVEVWRGQPVYLTRPQLA